MLFSELYNIDLKGDEEWFDPILTRDTLLFIDPFEVFKSKDELFKDAYSDMMKFFQQVFELIAQAGGNKDSIVYKKAKNMLLFPEDNSFCLGYSKTNRGSGTGPKWSNILAGNINSIVALGVTNISHFEVLGIFCTGVGPDRLSDMTTNLLKRRFIKYTQKICDLYKIPTKRVRIQNAYYDEEFKRWCSDEYYLPINPYKDNSPIILVPKGFLDVLPEINSDDFQRTINLSERLRDDINYEIDGNLDKEKIAEIAINNYDLIKEYISIVENRESSSFNEKMKKTLRYSWYEISKEIAEEYKFEFGIVEDDESFLGQIAKFTDYFKRYIEKNAGYKLLWNEEKTKPRKEEDVQILFSGIVGEHCRANNIVLSGEVDQGSGPVDFKFSSGYSKRVLLEVKLAKNTRFWNGLKNQLPSYMEAESCKMGIFLVIAFTDNDIERVSKIQNIARETEVKFNIKIQTIIVDARVENKISASKL